MLQRIQTLFLILIVILSTLLLFVPFQHITTSDTFYNVDLKIWAMNSNIHSTIYLPFSLNILIILLSLFTIFKYKNKFSDIFTIIL